VRHLYQTLPGWQEDVTGARQPSDLPENARRYVAFVADHTGLRVTLVSVGPARDQIVQGW
jgi:adenylosuccinate synthase